MINIINYRTADAKNILKRDSETNDKISSAVTDIIKNVRINGDRALKEYADIFDGGAPENFEVTEYEINKAYESCEPKLIDILKKAADNIRDFHTRQVRQSFISSGKEGVMTGQKIIPIEKVGLYVPGGTAAYPSTVLMNAIPAQIAGCSEIVITTPAKNGVINPAILSAAKISGVTRIFKVGGAQAIAALAYGTESIPRVDKIVGPGNAYVAEAKKQVFGIVSIDMIAGPSEILVISDKYSNPAFLAADLLSQAEHDKMASAVLLCNSMELARSVSDEIEKQIPLLSRSDIARESIDNNGKIIVTKDIEEAVELANDIAPEHLELCVEEPFNYLSMIKNAGSVFMGRYCPEALGDYMAGPNHTLPTGGTARFSSPLSVDDFIKKTQFTYYTKEAFRNVSNDIKYFAGVEGLEAHGKSAVIRFSEEKADE